MEHQPQRVHTGHRPGHPLSQDGQVRAEAGTVKPIILVPVGNADPKLLAALIPLLRDVLHAPARVQDLRIDPAQFYDEARGQYNSTTLLHALKQETPPD